ncbi:phage tail terminator-like protein [Phenylobacterium sp. VNQ135]|uniref:phage tail terminator-like protein n=1 Tax=Phenylobacterium sp. VNQ135 TaxID=3400922 RepID=UPI003BFE703B
MKASEIPAALLERLTSLEVGSPPLPIAYPDVSFDPATDAPQGKYLEAGYFRNAPAWEGLSEGVLDQGLLVVSVVWPKGQGVIAMNAAAQAVADHFPKGLTLKSGSTAVKINREPVIASPLTEGDKTIVAISIPWVA